MAEWVFDLLHRKTAPCYKGNIIKMKVPNLEVQVQASLNLLFYNYLCNKSHSDSVDRTMMIDSLLNKDFDDFKNCIHTLFSSIVYDNHTGNNLSDFEGYYASVIFTYISALGVPVIAEDHSSLGRADMTMFLPNSIIIIQFKVDMISEAAIEQIKTKTHCEKYALDGRQIYMIGMNFDSTQKNITSFDMQIFE